MSIHIKEVDENLFDEEIHLCLPPKDSPRYTVFESGIKNKRIWLKERLDELGSVAQIAYHKSQAVAFIEYISAKNAPVSVGEEEKTALITCIYKPKFSEKGVGTTLVQAALERLRQLNMEYVKTLVIRNPEWITKGVYFKNGFQHEKTFYKAGCAEPFDLLTLNLKAQTSITQPSTINFAPPTKNSLPIDVICFNSGQCPFNAVICARLLQALTKFDTSQFVLKVFDSWEDWKLAREYGSMYMDILINGKAPFLGPSSQEKIEDEIRKEIERIKGLR